MQRAFFHAEELAGTLNEYVDTRIESVKLEVAEKTAIVSANIITGIILAVFFSFFLALGSIALSILIGAWLGKLWAGFFITACIYLIITIVLWVNREKIIRLPVTNALIKQFFSKSDEQDQHHRGIKA